MTYTGRSAQDLTDDECRFINENQGTPKTGKMFLKDVMIELNKQMAADPAQADRTQWNQSTFSRARDRAISKDRVNPNGTRKAHVLSRTVNIKLTPEQEKARFFRNAGLCHDCGADAIGRYCQPCAGQNYQPDMSTVSKSEGSPFDAGMPRYG